MVEVLGFTRVYGLGTHRPWVMQQDFCGEAPTLNPANPKVI